jgi:hypothetical protein
MKQAILNIYLSDKNVRVTVLTDAVLLIIHSITGSPG